MILKLVLPGAGLAQLTRLALLSLLLAGITQSTIMSAETVPVEIRWNQLTEGELVPPRPEQISPLLGVVMGLLSESSSSPSSPRLIRKFDGQKVQISGFPVPLRFDGFKVREFLLVPYYGACIHVPPPPRNQIIHVITEEPVRIGHLSRSIKVSGRFEVGRMATGWGESGYRIAAKTVEY